MKCNENKLADVTLRKLHFIVNAFIVRFRTSTLQTQGDETTLVQRCFNVVTLKQHRINTGQYRPAYEYRVPLKGNPLPSIKNSGTVTESFF